MIDIHAHVIPYVDDGSKSMDESLKILADAYNAGVTHIFCTPHYRKGSFQPSAADIKENFLKLKEANNTSVKLYLGQEISVFGGVCTMINNGELLTLNDTKYVLLEFPYTSCGSMTERIYDVVFSGYKPILAHVERYEYVDLDKLFELRKIGALVQVNADSLVSKFSFKYNKRVKRYIKEGAVDFVASDIHASRQNCLAEAYMFVKKNYGEETAADLFENNPRKLID